MCASMTTEKQFDCRVQVELDLIVGGCLTRTILGSPVLN
jgi:hypothetical protein